MENKFILKAIIQLTTVCLVVLTAFGQGGNGATNAAAAVATRRGHQSHPLVLIPSISRGDAPLTVNFTLNAAGLTGAVQTVAWDWRGDGTSNLTTSNLSGQSHIYDVGTYFPVVTVTTSQGTFSSGGGIKANMMDMLANPVAIVAYIPPQIVWSQNVAGPVAVKAKADESVYVLKDNPATFLLYSNNGGILASFDLTTIHFSPLTANGFDVDSNGCVYVAMTSLNQILMLKPSGNGSYIPDIGFNRDATLGIPGSILSAPWDVAVSPDGAAIYVSDSGNHRVVKVNTTNQVLLSIGDFSNPQGLSYDASGRLLVADPGKAGTFSIVNDSVFDGCRQTAIKATADSMLLYVTDGASVKQLDSYSYTIFRQIPASIGLNNPRSVSIWPSQTEKRVYIADYGNNRVIGVAFPRPDPLRVWSAMKNAVANNNLTEALTYFSMFSAPKYKAQFQAVGLTNISTMLNRLTNMTVTEMTDSFAYYRVIVPQDGAPVTFYINFANENGIWKISSF